MTTRTDHVQRTSAAAQKTSAARIFSLDELRKITYHLEQAVRLKVRYLNGTLNQSEGPVNRKSLAKTELAELILNEMGADISETSVYERKNTPEEKTSAKYDLSKLPRTWEDLDIQIRNAAEKIPKLLEDSYSRFCTDEGGKVPTAQEINSVVSALTKTLETLAPRSADKIRL